MDWLLRTVIASLVRRGNLRITSARGGIYTFGDGTGDRVAVRFKTWQSQLAVLFDPELKLGEAYMDGTFVVESGTIADFLALAITESYGTTWARLLGGLRYVWRRLRQFNVRGRARRNVAHHYDLDERLYALFLDSDRQYSCAYFDKPGMSLDDAQLAKRRHIASKLLIDKNLRVLDIGCGWGGLALYLAGICGARVTGVTLSQSRAREDQLGESTEFRLQDYRDVSEMYDRLVSVGMFEHVGVMFYDTFFRKCRELLAEDGVMLLHSIGRSDGPCATNPWITKYIFPGGYMPALSEVLPAIERAGLLVTDIEIVRLHYAETLKAWRQRFIAHRGDAEKLYDGKFLRMWEFYLAASEMAFRKQHLMVFQIQMTRRQGVVPITRDYIEREEARLRALEQASRLPLRLAGE